MQKILAQKDQSQIDRFKEAARQLECDDNEARFDAKLKKVAKAKTKDAKDDQ